MSRPEDIALPRGLGDRLQVLFPGAEVLRVRAFAADAGADAATRKAEGYGRPIRVDLLLPDKSERSLVFRTATANGLGHERRADRAAEVLLAHDTFGLIPSHVTAIDVGAISRSGRLESIRDAGELYLITGYAPGRPYAEDLREISRSGTATRRDLRRAELLAEYLAELHLEQLTSPLLHRRAVRDLVGSGEGIFGVIDDYPLGTPGASAQRLARLERACVEWRPRLKERVDRLRRIHGDFHPFNLLFDEGDKLALVDASRGCAGDPADDLTALAINYLFFAIDRPAAWPDGFRRLWRVFWPRYFARRDDPELLELAPPYFAWRALVVCNPRFYPALSEGGRDRLLALAEQSLARGRLSLDEAEALFE